MRSFWTFAITATLLVSTSGCGYRLVRPSEVEIPTYEPRPVSVPAACDTAIEQTTLDQLRRLSDLEARELEFCQRQHLLRSQEEEAASRLLEAHAEVANFALRATVVVVGALVAVLTWVF